MTEQLIGIIGGTGLGDWLAARSDVERVYVDTPFGQPSGPLLRGKWNGVDVVFLNRHGDGHLVTASSVPYRANIFALKQIGVTQVIASGAVGSLRAEIEPGHLAICDQLIDKTQRRAGSFFDDGVAVHVEMADPFCPALRSVLLECASGAETTVHERGTYVVMDGPQFSTRAESNMHRAWGADLIGMTCMPEAKLAREAELCYAMVALATDYDCWRPHTAADKQTLLGEILANLRRATDHAIKLIDAAVIRLAQSPATGCNCQRALEMAIWSDKSKVGRQVVRRLQPLIGRYFADIDR